MIYGGSNVEYVVGFHLKELWRIAFIHQNQYNMRVFHNFRSALTYVLQPQKFQKVHLKKSFGFNFLHHNHEVSLSLTTCIKRSTIFALSTPSGVSAIAVIRISGPNASDVLYQMGKFPKLPIPRKAILCKIRDPVSEELLDKALVLWFPSPNSFTGEDMCELHVHGGIAVVKSILKSLMKMKQFRMAEPGEFTKRAFLANKLDLTEVEGLCDLLHSETEIQQKQALRQMDGMLNQLYNDWSNRIKKCLANVEAYIDFSEDQHLDGSILKSVQSDLDKLREELSSHVSDYRKGERQRNGVFTVLIGRPNVGKSSLLNSLCQRDIAIVSPIAGTTRDIIETSFNLDGYLVNISDTAGIRVTDDSIEIEGVKRATDKSSTADLLIFILEAKRVLEIIASTQVQKRELVKHLLMSELGGDFVESLKNVGHVKDTLEDCVGRTDKIILLFNKIDLLEENEKKRLMQLEDSTICAISCTEGIGMNKFITLLKNTVKEMCTTHRGEEPIITQERHRVYVQTCLRNLQSYENFVDTDIAIAAEKLRVAMNELGKITGKVRVDDILDVVFRDFCIGK